MTLMLVQAWEWLIQTTRNEVLKRDRETARRGVESEAMRLSGEVKPWGTMWSAGAEGCRRKAWRGRAGADCKAFEEPSARTWPLCGLTSARLVKSLRLHSNPDFPTKQHVELCSRGQTEQLGPRGRVAQGLCLRPCGIP